MKHSKYIRTICLVIFSALVLTTSSACLDEVLAGTAPQQAITTSQQDNGFIKTTSLAIVNSPKSFLNKKIQISAKFDKFSTLGLDYKVAMRSSEDYISFLIKRDDTKYNIPLSEMKLFLKRDYAEKFIDLKTDDKIDIQGTVFSDALGDSWIDVSNIKIIEKAPEKK